MTLGDLIHPDFILTVPGAERFRQNKPWPGPEKPFFKVIFGFDDSTALANFPFTGKISIDVKGNHRFFGVAYCGVENWREVYRYCRERFLWAELLAYD